MLPVFERIASLLPCHAPAEELRLLRRRVQTSQVAITAVMRKLMITAIPLLKADRLWVKTFA